MLVSETAALAAIDTGTVSLLHAFVFQRLTKTTSFFVSYFIQVINW